MKAPSVNNRAIQFSVLREKQCADIFDTAVRVLEKTGCEVKYDEAVKIFAQGGAKIDGTRVRISRDMVEKAMKTMPREIQIYDTEGNPHMMLSARTKELNWSTCLLAPNILDRHTDEVRPGTYRDAYEAGLVNEAMPNISMITGLCYISDCKYMLSEVFETRALLETSVKPHILTQMDTDALQAQLDMYATVAWGMEKFVKKPFGLFFIAPTPPLCHAENALKKAIHIWKVGVPNIYHSGVMLGATGPMTMAGGLASGLADVLAGLVLSQLVNPGTPFMGSVSPHTFDMVNMNISYTPPETLLAGACLSDIWRYLDMPGLCGAGGTDSPLFDQQAAGDIGMYVMSYAIAGGCLNPSAGYLESANTACIESLAFYNELIGISRRYVEGIDVNEETLAEEVTNAVGPQGNFLGEEHTMRHFRESWMHDLFIHKSYQKWGSSGRQDLRERCIERVDSIIATGPQNPRDPELLKELDTIVKACEAKH